MNKLTKIGVSALAGSLALTAAHAAEVSLSGGVAVYLLTWTKVVQRVVLLISKVTV